jgi:hypothetical protein
MLQLTQSTQQTDLLGTINESILGQSENLATSIGASIEAAIAKSNADKETDVSKNLEAQWGEADAKIKESSASVDVAKSKVLEAEAKLGGKPEGVSTQDFINQQKKSINEKDLTSAEKIVSNGRTRTGTKTYSDAKALINKSNNLKSLEAANAELVSAQANQAYAKKQQKDIEVKQARQTPITQAANEKYLQSVSAGAVQASQQVIPNQEVAAAIQKTGAATSQKMSVAGGGVTVEENRKLLSDFGYKQGEGFASSEDEQKYKDELKKLKDSKKAQAASSAMISNTAAAVSPVGNVSPVAANAVANPATVSAVKNNQSQPAPQQNTQENIAQLISNVLQVVQKISTEFEKAGGGQAGQGGENNGTGTGAGSVNVSNSVNLTVSSANGENKPETKNAAEKIKTDLAAFLSSPEFVDKVTSIAKQATGDKQPPKQIPA